MAFFNYKGVSFNDIYSKTDTNTTPADVTMTGFKESNISLIYDPINGSVSKQNYINYSATPTDYFQTLSANYVDYTSTQDIIVNPNCKEIRVLLCGAGGSGGGGAGDTSGQRGMSGSGGGGGAYYYHSYPLTTIFNFNLSIGVGGLGVSGSGGGNSGKPGNNGGNTVLSDTTTVIAQADGGSGGLGGHPDNTLPGGLGATSGTGTLILPGANGSNSTGDRTFMPASPGGVSGLEGLIGGNSTYPKLYFSVSYGKGGSGSRGEYDPQTIPSEAGVNGWARIYYLY